MTTALSLILIAAGAVLAFAVSYEVASVDIRTIGAILIVVGGIGLAISIATLAGYAPWGGGRGGTGTGQPPAGITPPTNV